MVQEWYEYGKDVFIAKCAGSGPTLLTTFTDTWVQLSYASLVCGA